METQIYRNFLAVIRIVKDKAANEILQDAAAVRLGIKQKLEMAALKKRIDEYAEMKGRHPNNESRTFYTLLRPSPD